MRAILYLAIIIIFSSCKKNSSELIGKVPQENVAKDTVKDKKYLKKDANGNVQVDGWLSNGKKHGVWKYYDKTSLKEVKRFSNDSLLYILDKDDYIIKGVLIKKINAYLPVPVSWDTNTTFDDKSTLLTSVKKCDDNLRYCPNVVWQYGEFKSESLEKDVTEYIEKFKAEYPNVKIFNVSKNTLISKESYILRAYIDHQGVGIAQYYIWIKDKNNVIVGSASCEATELEKNLHLFMTLVNSIKFIE